MMERERLKRDFKCTLLFHSFNYLPMGDDGEPEVLGSGGDVRAVVFKDNMCVIIILCKKT